MTHSPLRADAEFAGRIALVTGGAGSVGRVVVERLAERGATVLLNCFHSYEAAKQQVSALVDRGLDVRLIRGSVARRAQVERMFAEIAEEHGRLDILVNNAAAGSFVPFEEITEELLDRTYATNVKGPLWCAQYARPLLAASGRGGAIVNVSSLGAATTPANYLPTGVSKAALESLTRYLAAELAQDRIRVNAASCGLIDNPVGRLFPEFEDVRANTVAATPLSRLGRPEDLAEVVLFLSSERSGWVTGQTVLADGGLTLLRSAMSPTPEPMREPAPRSFTEPAPRQKPQPAPRTAPFPPETPATPETPQTSRTAEAPDDDPIAVVGMGLAIPGASSPEEFWRLLTDGAELFVDAPRDRWDISRFHAEDRRAPDKTYQRRSGFITDFRPHEKLRAEGLADAGLDHTALWLRHSLHQALEGVRRADGDRFSFCVGYTPDGSQHLEEAYVLGHALETLAEDGDEAVHGPVGDALRRRFGRGGEPAEARHPHRVGQVAMDGILPEGTRLHMVDTACSSSLYAMDLGVRDLLSGRSDVAVCGGSFALAPSGSILFAKLNGLSTGGAVRALDADADGALFSDGAGLVVLKRLSRARADGDRILGVVSAIGLSADGRGKAIYAPAPAGQELAVERAFERSGLGPDDIDWIVAHATGTPAGDEAEFTSLAQRYSGDRVQQVTSNKSLVGHCGWAAGVVSVIHTLLALRHGTIPAQYRFSRLPDALAERATGLTVPRKPVPWPADGGRPRRAAVSGFGFGGTNAHVIISEDHSAVRTGHPAALPAPLDEDLVVVGWSSQLPGSPSSAEVAAWATGDRDEDFAPSFGMAYPVPPFKELRMPPPTARTTDRTQLAMIRCMQALDEPVRELCLSHHRTTGVVVGHTGATRNALLYKSRAYLDEIRHVVAGAGEPGTEKFTTRLEERATGLIAAPTEDSFPGAMPNVIAARLSNYFDLRGLNITVEAGEASLLEAFDVAGSYLDFREIDVALVAGVNGTALPGWNDEQGRRPAEGAFLFVMVRRSLAEERGLPVLAVVERSVAA
ncbi:SDR family oxidoreductase [Streptomyces sp. PTY087I2]|uniref:SDR family oxidoreductase n=1 Tax=Streptomyces sp. PTY087I2 TaxID=1819298 RepID=UPI00080BF5CA|nr:SDR family oxidoreductase [Streptomyces sp. PTY087I2]OCC10601.1 Phthiocerol synthesis polyketide synthase type I PpsC [Streptomyces sp. PTY087I2]